MVETSGTAPHPQHSRIAFFFTLVQVGGGMGLVLANGLSSEVRCVISGLKIECLREDLVLSFTAESGHTSI